MTTWVGVYVLHDASGDLDLINAWEYIPDVDKGIEEAVANGIYNHADCGTFFVVFVEDTEL